MISKALAVLAVTAVATSTAADGNWWETIKVKGDLRYRHEMIDTDDSDARHRHRVRARLGVFGDVSERTTVGIQLATGGENPVSTNQTLGGAFSTKSFGVDLAYLQTAHERLPGLSLTAGKFKNPFYKPGGSELIWDSDWNPEGGVLAYTTAFKQVSITLMGSGLWIEERSSSDDSWLGAAQGAITYSIEGPEAGITVGGGFFNYVNTEGLAPFYDGKFRGNSVGLKVEGDNTTQVYLSDYELLEVGGAISASIIGLPVIIMGDFVTNTAADSLNTGWLVGFKVGAAKQPFGWEVRYCYREVEADAVVATFTDSDFRGGGTDARGHEIGGALALDRNTAFKLTWFDNEIGLDNNEQDFKRLQVDVQLKF